MGRLPLGVTESDPNPVRWLLAIASVRELDAALNAFGYRGAAPKLWDRIETKFPIDLVWTGVGKANACGAVARVLDPSRHLGVLSVGIGGVLPEGACAIGEVVCASESFFADEGILTPDGFESCAKMGFSCFGADSDSITHRDEVIHWLSPFADHLGPIACVSICSGTDQAAREIASRTGAICEAMEGAGVALAAWRVDPSILTGELRVISNTTGDRNAQQWDLDGALAVLSKVLGRIANGLD